MPKKGNHVPAAYLFSGWGKNLEESRFQRGKKAEDIGSSAVVARVLTWGQKTWGCVPLMPPSLDMGLASHPTSLTLFLHL